MPNAVSFLVLLLLANTSPAGKETTRVAAPDADYRQPQLAAGGKFAAAAFASKETITVALSRDGGVTFGQPIRVAEVPGLNLGMHRGPRVAFSGSTLVVTAVNGKSDGNLLAWRSADSGKTWNGPVVVNDRPRAAREGLDALVAMPDGRLFAAWLDLRNLVPGQPGTELWGAYSTDGGKTWAQNVPVYKSPAGTICQCCHPSLMSDAKGVLHVMWRNVMNGDRDLYTAASSDGGKTWGAAAKLGQGTWQLDACPMDGGGIAAGAEGQVVTAWRRQSTVYLARQGEQEKAVAEGKNPTLAVGHTGAFVLWTTPQGLQARIPGQAKVELLDADGAFPQAVALPDGHVLAAWEHKGAIEFKRF